MKYPHTGDGPKALDPQHNPNVGENQNHWSGKAGNEGAKSIGADSAGVVSGLSSAEKAKVKNAEMICQNQRPKARRVKAGKYQIGT